MGKVSCKNVLDDVSVNGVGSVFLSLENDSVGDISLATQKERLSFVEFGRAYIEGVRKSKLEDSDFSFMAKEVCQMPVETFVDMYISPMRGSFMAFCTDLDKSDSKECTIWDLYCGCDRDFKPESVYGKMFQFHDNMGTVQKISSYNWAYERDRDILIYDMLGDTYPFKYSYPFESKAEVEEFQKSFGDLLDENGRLAVKSFAFTDRMVGCLDLQGLDIERLTFKGSTVASGIDFSGAHIKELNIEDSAMISTCVFDENTVIDKIHIADTASISRITLDGLNAAYERSMEAQYMPSLEDLRVRARALQQDMERTGIGSMEELLSEEVQSSDIQFE